MRLRWLVAALLGLSAPAAAHLMPAGHGTVNVVGQKAYVVLALPVAAFAGTPAAPAVADGVLTPAELAAHQAALKAAVRARLSLAVDGVPATVGAIILNQAPGGPGAPAHRHDLGELTVMAVVRLPAAPGALGVGAELWASAQATLKLEATVTAGGQLARREVHTLTPKAATHRFFTGATAPPDGPQAHARPHGAHAHPHGAHAHPHAR